MIQGFTSPCYLYTSLYFIVDLMRYSLLDAELLGIWYFSCDLVWYLLQARIALERRKFLKNADIAVQRQTTWSNLAHEMTSEFRSLCAEEVQIILYKVHLGFLAF
jgi:hypothetical protein